MLDSFLTIFPSQIGHLVICLRKAPDSISEHGFSKIVCRESPDPLGGSYFIFQSALYTMQVNPPTLREEKSQLQHRNHNLNLEIFYVLEGNQPTLRNLNLATTFSHPLQKSTSAPATDNVRTLASDHF